MDKKNTVIGVLLIAAAFVFMLMQPKPPPAPAKPAASAPATTTSAPAAATAPAATATAPVATPSSIGADGSEHLNKDGASATVTALANDFIEVHFSDAGGAIREVALKKYPTAVGNPAPFVFNAEHVDPMLALVDLPGLDRSAHYERVSATANEVVYRTVLDGRVEVTRRYTLAPSTDSKTDPYQLRHETTFKNLTDKAEPLTNVKLALGTATPGSPLDLGQYTKTGYLNSGSTSFVPRSSLDVSGGFLGFGAHDARPPVTSTGAFTWLTVQNQFFVSLFTPDTPASALVTSRVKLREATADDKSPNSAFGLSGIAQFELKPLAPHAEAKLGGSLYVGPKEYTRLSNTDVFKADQDRVMDFGLFGWASKLLLTLMTKIHSLLPVAAWTWSFSIILTTLTLKLVFLWPTFAAARSMKRMAKLQPQLQALREKYKDNPGKLNQATMDLFKEHKVNPLGGCLPMLIPLPFFMGFFSMLQSAAELRLAPFLWAADLSAPDTVGHIPGLGLAINVLPLLFTAIMFIQMRLTPTPNADPMQVKMMQFMPLFMLFIYYSFSCALSLYSLTNALFTIGQQVVINKMKDDGDPANKPGGVSPGGKPLKNVTPKKK